MPGVILGTIGLKMVQIVSLLREIYLVIKTKLVKAHFGRSSTYHPGGWALEGGFVL